MSFRPLFDSSPEPSRAFRHFTDRVTEQAAFGRCIECPVGSVLPVMMFYGVGGTGKSWLLQKLQQNLAATIPSARISFEPAAGAQSYSTDFARALAACRHQLGDVFCPRFDIAYAWLRFKEGGSDEPQLRHAGYATTAWELVREGADALLSSVPGGNLITWLTKRAGDAVWSRVKDSPLIHWLGERIGQDDYLRLKALPRDDIYAELPRRLLQDLSENLPERPGSACRGVIFFDGYEWLTGSETVAARRAHQDSWVRELYHPESGVLLVLAGRDRLTWDAIQSDFARSDYLEQHLVGGLSEPDARQFLENCGIADRALQDAVLRVSPDQASRERAGDIGYHAFSLGLCADTIDTSRRQGVVTDSKTFDFSPGDLQQLALRFLRSLSDGALERWICRLALTPRFDETAARAAFSPHRDAAQDAAWDRLDDYSFLISTQPKGWWTLHPRMRQAVEAIHQRGNADHGWWQEHWRARQTSDVDELAGLAWFHHWQLDADAARNEWAMLAEREHRHLRMAAHYQLLHWWKPTVLGALKDAAPTRAVHVHAALLLGKGWWESSQGSRNANLQNAITCFETALRVISKADLPYEWVWTQVSLGLAYGDLPAGDRAENLARAIACYEAAWSSSARRIHRTNGRRLKTTSAWPTRTCRREIAVTISRGPSHAIRPRCGSLHRENYRLASKGIWALHWRICPPATAPKICGKRFNATNHHCRSFRRPKFPTEWAGAQLNLGGAYIGLPTGNRSQHLRQAVECFNAALRVSTEDDFPREWATAQLGLGGAYAEMPTGNRNQNLQRAIECYESSLRVFREADFPEQWATAQNRLGAAWASLPTGNHADNVRRAIDCYKAALRVYTPTHFPYDWAMTQRNLGNAWFDLPTGDSDENLQAAIGCHEAALHVFTEADYPQENAATQNNLGLAHAHLVGGDRNENLRRAIACYQAALRGRTETGTPQAWAGLQNNFGIAYAALTDGDRGENVRRAIECHEAALGVYTEAEFPREWAKAQHNLGAAFTNCPTGDRGENLRRAIGHYEAALRVRTEADYPRLWANTQSNLGVALKNLPMGNRMHNLQRAVACFEASLRVFTESRFPLEWAGTQENLAGALAQLFALTSVSSEWDAAINAAESAARGFRACGDHRRAEAVEEALTESRSEDSADNGSLRGE